MDGNYTRPGPTVALIQGSIDVEVKTDERQLDKVFEEFYKLSRQALEQQPNLDLLVWPETMFRFPLIYLADDFHPPSDRVAEMQQKLHTSRKNLQDLRICFAESSMRNINRRCRRRFIGPGCNLFIAEAIEIDEQHFNSRSVRRFARRDVAI
jgi:hypothetical protein